MSVCFDSSGIPVPCTGWTVYDSYVTDPRYQKYFTIAWTSAFAVVFVCTLPAIVTFARRGLLAREGGNWRGLFGVYDSSLTRGYEQVQDEDESPPIVHAPSRRLSRSRKPLLAVSALFHSLTRSCPRIPFVRSYYSSLSTGHFFALVLIPALLLATLFPESRLAENPNRFGFLALACIPPLFVLSSKNGAVNFLLGRSWTTVNFLHRWLGRAVLLLVICHFALWSVQWARAGELAEFLSSSKERRGLGAFAFLLLITVSSLPKFRRFSYPVFFALHYVSIIGFLVFLNQHTIYARGWATWSVVAIYAVDIAGRVASVRIRWVEVEALQGEMTKVAIRGVTGGWTGGQTIDLRLFFVPPLGTLDGLQSTGGESRRVRIKASIETLYRSIKAAVRPFESHPFSIATAPPSRSIPAPLGARRQEQERGIELYIKSCGTGTWSDDLYRFASSTSTSPSSYDPLSTTTDPRPAVPVQANAVSVLALFFGPYASGLPTYSSAKVFEDQETVSLFAGGSGMSFVFGVLEELIGRRTRQGRGGQIEVTWVVREQAHVSWFLPRLETVLSSIPTRSPLIVSLAIHVTTRRSSPPSLDGGPEAAASLALPPRTTLSVCSSSRRRPDLASILSDQVSRILSPCQHCYPVCRCGETNLEGTCANEEEECVGGCGGVGNGTELLFDTRGPGGGGGGGRLGREGFVVEEKDEIDELPEEGGNERVSTGCCRQAQSRDDEARIVESTGGAGGKTCCNSTVAIDLDDSEKKGCRSSRYPPTTGVEEAPVPLKVRNGGLSVIVCGPQGMTGELRNAVASIPIAKQVRIGGVDLHVEQFGI